MTALAPPDAGFPVTVADRVFDLPADGAAAEATAADASVETVACEYRCGTGEEFSGRWRGVALGDLLTAAEADPAATHVVVESVDGFRACLPVCDALSATLAVERLDAAPEGLPRLVGDGVDGTRTVKRVTRVSPRTLDPGTDPEDVERLTPEEATP